MLRIDNLKTTFKVGSETLRAVDGVSFSIPKGKVLGIVGESGSGKSVTALSVLGLLPGSATLSGSVTWNDQELVGAKQSVLKRIRGGEIGLIFQNALAAFNPVFTLGQQMIETLRLHHDFTKSEAKEKAVEWLIRVNIPDPELRMTQYPHEFSLGMCQRMMIALTLSMQPSLLIADEPTASLDVTIQAQILTLLRDLQRELGMSVWMISHDLGVIAQTCDEIAVMYLGKIVEQGTPLALFSAPQHPYTQALIAAIPKADPRIHQEWKGLEGDIPSPLHLPSGCRFHPRCPECFSRCKQEEPELRVVRESKVACFARIAV